jgi:hypothetical protein
MSPRLVQNIIWANPNLDPGLLCKLINGLVLAFERRDNFDHFQWLLLEEQWAAKL